MNLEAILSSLRTSLASFLFFYTFVASAQLEYATGTLQEDEAYDALEQYDLSRYQLSLPRSYSVKTFLPKVGNQVKLPQGVSWAISHSVTILENARLLDGSEVINRSPFFVNMLLSDEIEPCKQDLSLFTAINKLEGLGLPSINQYAYPCPSNIDEKIIEKAREEEEHFFEKAFDRLLPIESKVERIKRRLILDQPVMISMHTPPSFVYAEDFWSPNEKFTDEFPLHTMVVVGFDDGLYGGSFEIVNSWGKSWGNDGYIYLRYEDMDFVRYGVSVANALDNKGNYSLFNGELSLKEAESDTTLDILQFSHRGYFQLNVKESALDFYVDGKANKPFYLKMYYKAGDDVTRIYPADSWRSSLFNFGYTKFDLPGDGQFYSIEEDLFSSVFCFFSLDNIDEIDFTPVVRKAITIGDLINTEEYEVSRLVIWSEENAKFSGRLAEGEIVPLLIDLSFKN